MKKCRHCDRTYADETLTYCLADGALLSAPYDPSATLVLPSSTRAPLAAKPSPTKRSDAQAILPKRNFNLSHVIILVLAMLLVGTAVALVYERGKVTDSNSKSESPTPMSTPSVNPSFGVPSQTPTPKYRPGVDPNPLFGDPSQTPTPTPTPTPSKGNPLLG
jgi:hypothetical protein